MSKYVTWGLVVAALLVMIYLINPPLFNFLKGENKSSQLLAAQGTSNAIPVSAVIVQPRKVDNKIVVTGSIIANESVELKSEVSGLLRKIYFKEGSKVKKGDLLVHLKADELEAQLEKLRYSKKLLEDSEYRQRKLLEKEAISQEEYEIAMAELQTSQAEIKVTEAQIAKTKIRAPFDGIIGLRYISEGSYITSDDPIAYLYNISPAKIDFSIPGKYSNKVNVGDIIRFSTDAMEEMQEGKIYAIEPQVDTETRSLKMRAVSPNDNDLLLPGQFTKIELIFSSIDSAIMVPAESVIPELGGHRVMVNKGGKMESVQVEVGIRTESEVQVVSGLHPQDTVITSGILQLRPGADVDLTILN